MDWPISQFPSELWHFISRNFALSSIVATLTLLVVIPYLVIRKYVLISLNIFTDTEPPLSRVQVSHPRLPGDDVDFWSEDGVRLRGVFMHPVDGVPRKGLILFAPEFKSDRYSCARYCLPLIQNGYDVFSFDFRGHGDSARQRGYVPRQWASDREIADVRGALAFLRNWLEENHRPLEIGFFGISRGAAAGILTSARDSMVKCFVTDGAFSSDAALEHLMKRWAYIFAKVKFVYENHPPEFWMFLRWAMIHRAERRFGCSFPSVRKAIPDMLPRPMLFIHGERDSYIPVEQSRLLYALAPQPRYLWIVPDARHNQCVAVRPAEYARRTVEFFDRFLAGQCGPDNMYQLGSFAEMAAGERATARRAARDVVGAGDWAHAAAESDDQSPARAARANAPDTR
ncbi:MAG: alpha/beta hydrolase [Phycisphaerae bacterium]|nr:alpha/beta hydrolase [Phycisphaerae bacterium]